MGKRFKRNHNVFRSFRPKREIEKEESTTTQKKTPTFVSCKKVIDENKRSTDPFAINDTDKTTSTSFSSVKANFPSVKSEMKLSFSDQIPDHSDILPSLGKLTKMTSNSVNEKTNDLRNSDYSSVRILIPVNTILTCGANPKQILATFHNTIDEVIGKAREEFQELDKNASYIFVKNGVIIPGSLLIGDLIERRAFSPRKPGSLLFDVEKREDFWKVHSSQTTQAIIVDSTWYQSNKGIFPYSNWITFCPSQHF